MATRSPRYAVAFVASPGCDHEDLFHAHYKRANRLNAVKILRCFPHCCPDHVARSYCGSSLRLQVTGVAGEFDTSQHQVFAHFRESAAQAAQVGDSLWLNGLRGSLQSEENTGAKWIRSEFRGFAGDSGGLFEINPSRRWYYSWQSTRRNTDRLRTHVLEALVLSVDEASGRAKVVAVVESPPFAITSFRRSNAATEWREAQPLTALEAALLEMANSSPSSIPPETTTDAIPPPRFQLATSSPSPDRSQRFAEDLARVFACISDVRLHQVKEAVPVWDDIERATVSPVIDTSTREAMVSSVASWLCLDPGIHQAYELHAAQASEKFFDLRLLGAIYADWMRWLQAHLNHFLVNFDIRWCDVVAAASVREHARHRFSDPPPPRLPAYCFDWENFVARVRQHAINAARVPRNGDSAIISATEWTTELRTIRMFPAVVLSEPNRGTEIIHVFGAQELTADVAIAFTQQLSRIKLKMESSSVALTLEIRSVLHENQDNDDRQRDATRLVLDGRYRSFNTLPHGESALCGGSVLGGQCFGDYVGVVNSELQQVEVVCWSWPVDLWRGFEQADAGGANSGAYRWRWSLPLSVEDEDTLVVQVDVATASVVGVGPEGLACGSVRSRLGRVEDDWEEVFTARCTYRRAMKMGNAMITAGR